MVNITKTGDGFRAENKDGYMLCHVITVTDATAKGPGGPRARDDWRIHFSGYPMTAAELKALYDGLAAKG